MKKIKWHIIGVLVYSIYVLTLDVIYYKKFYYASELTILIAEIWIFYSGYSVLHFIFFSSKKKKFLSIIAFPISLIGAYFAILSNYLVKLHYFKKEFTIEKVLYNTSQYYTHFFIYALGYFFVERFIKKQKQLRLSEQQQAEMEKQKLEIENTNLKLQEEKALIQNEKIKLEYNFLKAQINPHFLYNTLNFFYAKTLIHSEEAADGIAKLTDIMRYALQQGGADGKVYLDQEVEHLHNYIALQQMRFNNTLCINLKTSGDISNHRILPHILITLLENAFKHGETLDPQHPIQVELKVVEECIYFSIHNKVRIGPKDGPSTGVGLQNISNRLQMEYGENQSLHHNSDGTFFDVHLSIQLTEKNKIQEKTEIFAS